MVFDPDKVLVWGSAVERSMWPLVVVEELMLGELGGGVGDGEGAVVLVPELDAGGPVGPLDAPVPLGLAGRQDLERDAPVLAGLLEVGHELAAAVDLPWTGLGTAGTRPWLSGSAWRCRPWRANRRVRPCAW